MFLTDDAGDIINLAWIESIMMRPLESEQEAPEGHTHELLAVNPAQESYRLTSGTKERVDERRKDIMKELMRYNQFLLTASA